MLSKIQLSRTDIRTQLTIQDGPLDSTIQNTAIAFENLSKIRTTDQSPNQSLD